jgi:hypothetical protein
MRISDVQTFVLGTPWRNLTIVNEWVKEGAPGLPEVDPADGFFPLPSGPGLGVTLNEDFVLAHPMEQVDFNLFRSGWEKRSQAATSVASSGYSRGR